MTNKSGIRPVEFNVLVKQDAIETKTKMGLVLPDEVLERQKHAQTRGTIVEISPLAFNEDVWPVGMEKPKAGDRIAFARHAGTFIEGLDGEEYRVIKDMVVVAMIEVANG